MLKIIKNPVLFCASVGRQFIDDNLIDRAAALSYTTLLSLVPLMAVSFSILAAFPAFKGIGAVVQDFIFKNFVATSAHVVQQHIEGFISKTSQLSATGLLFLVFTALIMIYNMELAFNAIWRVKEGRKGISAFLSYWAVLTLTPVLFGVSYAVGQYVISLPYVTETAESLGVIRGILLIAPGLLTLFAFTVIYIILPNCKVPFRYAFIGGIVATVLFESSKYWFSLYFVYFPNYQLLYGALAAIPIFLFWIYISWLIILLGGVISFVLTTDYKPSHKK